MRHATVAKIDLPTLPANTRIGIIHSSFYPAEVLSMVEDAKQVFIEAGISAETVFVSQVYGSFEIPLLGAALAKAKKVDALLGFGVIVEGETHHAALLAESTAQGMMQVQVEHAIPFAFEILYVNSLDQATKRSSGQGSKGKEAAYAVLQSLGALKAIRD